MRDLRLPGARAVRGRVPPRRAGRVGAGQLARALITGAAIVLITGCDAAGGSQNEAASWRLEEVARFGSLEGDGSALTRVAAVARTDSTVLVLESSPPRVAVFDHESRWLRDVGRAGDGPGELFYPVEIGTKDGNVWVGGGQGMRLEIFGPGGAPLASHRWSIPRDSLGDVAVPAAVLSDGSVLAGPRGTIAPDVRSRPWYRVTPAGEVLGLLYRQRASEGDAFVAQLPGGRIVIGLHPLPESPVVDIRPDGGGLVAVETGAAGPDGRSSFRVRIIGLDGAGHDFAVPHAPIPAEGWLERYAEEMERDMARSGSVDRTQLAAIRESIGPRDFYPPVSGVVAGTDGTVWIRREALIGADSVRWQVFDPNGTQLGAFTASTDLRILRASLEEIWAVAPGELDVPFVLRMRLASIR